MTLDEAIDIIRKKNPLLTIQSCLDFGEFYTFVLVPLYVEDVDTYVTGTIFPSVYKKSGRIFQYDITTDLNAFENAKKVI